MSVKIKKYLQDRYPEISDLLYQIRTIPKLRRRDVVLPEATVRVVTGQMLSAQAARTIYQRIRQEAKKQKLLGSWLLDYESLRACGLSGSKARAICELGVQVGLDVTGLDHWYSLPAESLINEVKSFRGLGDWSASILALFYVGHEDIFPTGDGSLQRAIRIIEKRSNCKKARPFSSDRAAPYRSYLALYLWRALDSGILVQN